MIAGRLFAFPSPLNGERVRVRGGSFVSVWQKEQAAERAHPSPSIPLPVEGRGKVEGDALGFDRGLRFAIEGLQMDLIP